MQKNIMDLDKVKSEYKNEKLTKFRELFRPRFSIINDSFDEEMDKNEKLNKDEDNNKKDNPIIIYNNTEVNQNLGKKKSIFNINKDNRKKNKKITIIEKNLLQKRFSMLPNIN